MSVWKHLVIQTNKIVMNHKDVDHVFSYNNSLFSEFEVCKGLLPCFYNMYKVKKLEIVFSFQCQGQ